LYYLWPITNWLRSNIMFLGIEENIDSITRWFKMQAGFYQIYFRSH